MRSISEVLSRLLPLEQAVRGRHGPMVGRAARYATGCPIPRAKPKPRAVELLDQVSSGGYHRADAHGWPEGP
jgi:hypothetical protein